MWSARRLLPWLLLCLLAAGCRKNDVVRYDLSGKVTYRGKPVYSGDMIFMPDKQRGNDGPGTQFRYYDGRYHTLPGCGTIGGPHIVTITAFEEGGGSDGESKESPFGPDLKAPRMKLLCPPVEIKVDLPRATGEYDFELPEPAAKGQ